MTELKLQQSLLDGRYEILECLGRGSYAEIYMARDLAAGSGEPPMVVIKALNLMLQGVLDADLERTLIENFQNEAVALDRVRHPNIISRLGHGTAIDLTATTFHYIILEYLAGKDLAAVCRSQPLSLERALFYLEQVCTGLAHAHDCGVIHRDIKPQNLLLTADGQTVKIADFGVAKIEATEGAITRVGTNIYAPPEHNPVIQTGRLDSGAPETEQPQLTPAADIYSLAKTTYALIAGESPRRYAHHPINELPEHVASKTWAPDVLRVLQKATANRPEDRYQTVDEFWQELSDASLPPTQPLKPPAERESPRRPSSALPKVEEIVEAPPRARFDSRDALKQSQLYANGKRPRIVVPVETPRPRIAPPPKPTPPNTQKVAKGRPIDDIIRLPAPPRKRGLRTIVAFLVIIAFAGLLVATHYYVTRQRILGNGTGEDSIEAAIGKEGLVNKPSNLRREPSMTSNPPLRTVQRGSRVRILSVSDNNSWYEVELLSTEGTDQDGVTRGWMGKSTIDVDRTSSIGATSHIGTT